MFIVEDFVVLALVVFSATVVIKDTDGPFLVFSIARDWLIVKKNGNDRQFFRELLACPWCIGTWVSFVVMVTYLYFSHCTLLAFLAYWIASVGVTGFLYTLMYAMIDE